MYELVVENQNRKPGESHAFVIGKDGVRQWLLERYDAVFETVHKFTDIRDPYME